MTPRIGRARQRGIAGCCAALLLLAWAHATVAGAAAPPLPEAWTRAPTITLWPGEAPGSAGFQVQALPATWPPGFIRNVRMPALHVFRPATPNGRAVLVIPGGAYQFVSVLNEGVELAPRLNALGFTVFVLTYRLPGEGWADRSRVPLQDAQRAMRVIRSRAGEYGIDPATVSVIGFSAGGHLAAMLATRHAEATYAAVDAADRLDARPLAVALVYPVATMRQPWTHGLSRELLLGGNPSDALVAANSAESLVSPATPPLFIVHALDDEAVPAQNSIGLAEALRAAQRPFEIHLLQEGGHAFGIGRPGTPSAYWVDQFGAWVTRLVP
jgi:acetyl esterase/lipase